MDGFLEHVHVFPFEHDDPQPAQLIERPQKGSLGIPSVGGDAVKEAGTVKAAHAAQQSQGRGAFVFAREDGLHIQHQIELGTAQVGKDVTVVELGHFDLLAVAIQSSRLGVGSSTGKCG